MSVIGVVPQQAVHVCVKKSYDDLLKAEPLNTIGSAARRDPSNHPVVSNNQFIGVLPDNSAIHDSNNSDKKAISVQVSGLCSACIAYPATKNANSLVMGMPLLFDNRVGLYVENAEASQNPVGKFIDLVEEEYYPEHTTVPLIGKNFNFYHAIVHLNGIAQKNAGQYNKHFTLVEDTLAEFEAKVKQETISGAETKQKAAEQEFEAAKNEVATTSAELTAAKTEQSRAESEKDTMANGAKIAGDNLKAVELELTTNLPKQLKDAEELLDTYKTALDDANAALDAAKADSVIQEYTSYENNLANAQAKVKETETTITEIKTKTADKESDKTSLLAIFTTAVSEEAKAVDQLKLINSEVERFEEQLKLDQKEEANAKAALDKAEQVLSVLQASIPTP